MYTTRESENSYTQRPEHKQTTNTPKLKNWAKWIEIQRYRNTYYIFSQSLTKKITPYTSQLRYHLAVGTVDHGKMTMILGRNA